MGFKIIYILELIKIIVCIYIVKLLYNKVNIINIKNRTEKLKSTNIYNLIKNYILDFSKSYNFKYLNITLFIVISLLIFILSCVFFYNIFNLIIPSIIISLLISTIPYNVIKSLLIKNRDNILKNFPLYVLSLKIYTDIDNNIIYAFSKSMPHENIKRYIDKFNTSVSSGLNVCSAFDTLKKDINIKEISQFINLIENCYLNGGSFSLVIQKYAKFQTEVNIQKEKEKQELYSSKVTLLILIVLSLFMVFGFVLNNEVYKTIILNTIGGQIILIINMLTYIFMYAIYLKICKMEE